MISDVKKPEGSGDGATSGHTSGFFERRLDALASNAGLSFRFSSVIGSTGMPHAEMPVLPSSVGDEPGFADSVQDRIVKEFAAATGVPATVRLFLPWSKESTLTEVVAAAKRRRLRPRRVIVELVRGLDHERTLSLARAYAQAGFAVALRLEPPLSIDRQFLIDLGADYLHVPSPPADFEEAFAWRDLMDRVTLRKGRPIVGGVETAEHARLVDAAGAWLTYGAHTAPARFLC
jgi:hypothetical protein